jgi:hypothetical protein
MSSALSRMVSLEWDRGHESLIAIVQAQSSAGFVISEIADLCEVSGRRWIRADEVVNVEDLDPEDPAFRLATLRGSLAGQTAAEPTDLDALLPKLQDAAAPIGVYTSRCGSAECLVGHINAIAQDHLMLDEIDSTGTATQEQLDFSLGEIIAIDWDNAYLVALDQLAQASADEEP